MRMLRLKHACAVALVALGLAAPFEAVLRAAILASDAFTQANGSINASNWTPTAGFGSGSLPVTVSNQVFNSSGQHRYAFYTGTTWPNDQYSQVVLKQFKGAVLVRVASVSSEVNAYYFEASTLSTTINLVKYTNNSGFSVLDTDTATVNANDVMYLEIQGTSLVAKLNGTTVLTATDSSFSSGSPGFGHGNIGDDTLDDWVGGDFSAGGTTPKRLTLLGVGGHLW